MLQGVAGFWGLSVGLRREDIALKCVCVCLKGFMVPGEKTPLSGMLG